MTNLADLPLFTLHKASDPETSRLAARDSREASKAQAAKIIELLDAYPQGLTNDEMDQLAGWDKGTAGRRKRDVERLLTIEGRNRVYAPTGETRLTRRGSRSNVWHLTIRKEAAA